MTQQLNTTTSMGRLTLNVLLSFAQFEREVTGERIRDKIAASKKKGMWMGGPLPLGYDVDNRKLVINKTEAETVRYIYQRYLALRSVRLLMKDLSADGIVSKVRVNKFGKQSGGQSFGRGALYRLLQNRMYLGEIVHKGHSYPGEQAAIIDEILWEKVQSLLNTHRVEHKIWGAAKHPSLLAGIIFDDQGERMTPTHAVKKGKRYRYYISNRLNKLSRDEVPLGCRIPAGDIEHLVSDRIQSFLLNESELFKATDVLSLDVSHHKSLINKANQFAKDWQIQPSLSLRHFFLNLITRVEVYSDKVVIRLLIQRLHDILMHNFSDLVPANETTDDRASWTLLISNYLRVF